MGEESLMGGAFLFCHNHLLLLVQLLLDSGHSLTKGWLNSWSRNDADVCAVCVRTCLYLQIIYQASARSFKREKSQRAALCSGLHVTALHMGNMELSNM